MNHPEETPIFDELFEEILKEEEKTYHNDMVPFKQYADKKRQEMKERQKEFIARLERGASLLKDKFKT